MMLIRLCVSTRLPIYFFELITKKNFINRNTLTNIEKLTQVSSLQPFSFWNNKNLQLYKTVVTIYAIFCSKYY